MPILTSKPFLLHLVGLGAVVAGAALTEQTGSMLPLAMGSALAVLTTTGLVRALHRRARARRTR